MIFEDAEWEAVKLALKSQNWDYRTVSGIATEVNISVDQVDKILKNNSDKIHVVFSKRKPGEPLIKLKSAGFSIKDVLSTIQALS